MCPSTGGSWPCRHSVSCTLNIPPPPAHPPNWLVLQGTPLVAGQQQLVVTSPSGSGFRDFQGQGINTLTALQGRGGQVVDPNTFCEQRPCRLAAAAAGLLLAVSRTRARRAPPLPLISPAPTGRLTWPPPPAPPPLPLAAAAWQRRCPTAASSSEPAAPPGTSCAALRWTGAWTASRSSPT